MAKPVDVRKARAFLSNRGVKSKHVSPLKLAQASEELGKSFSETLALLRQLMMAGQGQGPAPIAQKIAEKQGG